MPIRSSLLAIALGLLVAGCGPAKLNETKTLTLDKETMATSLSLSAQPKPQTITVEFSSSEGEVTVGVFKQDDIKDNDEMATVALGKALGHKKGKSESFTVDVPENTATRVVARGHTAAKTDVTVKVTNAK
jgi:hypothetical protein